MSKESFSEKAESFRNRKSALSPILKLETNIPTKILNVLSMEEGEKVGSDGSKYAQITFVVEVDTSEGIMEKQLPITSEGFVSILESNNVDIGSSFVVVKKGEGFHTKYILSEVKNKGE